ncbi:unnamed protein product [Porites evermanni]|uniref:Uncharacterized protein n=1 Tax=Porites evermanni TaxID=104178 RepID=A0ABN8L9L1_9CNID|nr:unnamed protein product [Porites evermanni]
MVIFMSLARRQAKDRQFRLLPQTSTPVKPLGQPCLLSTSELWSESPIRDIGGVDGESNKSAM